MLFFGPNFYNLDNLLEENIKRKESKKEDIKKEIEKLIEVYKRYENWTQLPLFHNVPETDRKKLIDRINDVYGEGFLKRFENGHLINYGIDGGLFDGRMDAIDNEGDLYRISLNRSNITPRITGLKLEPCYNPPKDLSNHLVYNSKYGVFVFSKGACYHIAIPKLLSHKIKKGKIESEDTMEEDLFFLYLPSFRRGMEYKHDKRELQSKDFIIVPPANYHPHNLFYNQKEEKLRWKTGVTEYEMEFSLSTYPLK